MKPFHLFPNEIKKNIRYVLTDIDDTLTYKGRLPSVIFVAMERLQAAGIRIIPLTGRPAGWCDHIARMWPIDALVGENGAFYFRYDDKMKKMRRRYWKSVEERAEDRVKLIKIKSEILNKIPGCQVSADQTYREADLAIDFCEDVAALSESAVDEIVNCFKNAGAQAKISSIHVNGWFGEYDKLSMAHILFEEIFREDLNQLKGQTIFIGDSPNDVPMFAYFPHSVGVANVLHFQDRLTTNPVWITKNEGGYGFSEMSNTLLS
jgi:HAD superfamily hydrolase (TIGR01484 family)